MHHGPTSKTTAEGINGVQLTTGPYHRTRLVVGAVNLSEIYCPKQLVDNVTSQTSHLTFFITEGKSKNYLEFKTAALINLAVFT